MAACSQGDANTKQSSNQESPISSSTIQSASSQEEGASDSDAQSDPAFEDMERKSRIQSEHRQLVTAVQMYFGDKLVDDSASVIDSLDSIDVLKPYMAIEESEMPSEALAKNPDGNLAHTLQDGLLTSIWKSSVSDEEQSWTYNVDPSLAP